jgi:hypothetical protein
VRAAELAARADERELVKLEYTATVEKLDRLIDVAIGWLSEISSADGSGHADLGRELCRRRALPAKPTDTRSPEERFGEHAHEGERHPKEDND